MSKGGRILVVDDDTSTCRALARLLGDDGLEVDLAPDGAVALAKLSSGVPPLALVTEVHLPLVNGLAVARHARIVAPGIAVIFATSHVHEAMLAAREMLPAPAILCKPYTYARLAGEIVRLISAGLRRDGACTRGAA